MKANQVLKLLKITRPTLTKYVKENKIRVTILPNLRYDYNQEDVYNLRYKNVERKIVLYSRVFNKKQKHDLDDQINTIKQYCFDNGIKLHKIYKDITSGLNFKDRLDFFNLLQAIIEGKIEKVIITHKDRLGRFGFEFFIKLFEQYNTQIIVIDDSRSKKIDSEEILGEINEFLKSFYINFTHKDINKMIE